MNNKSEISTHIIDDIYMANPHFFKGKRMLFSTKAT